MVDPFNKSSDISAISLTTSSDPAFKPLGASSSLGRNGLERLDLLLLVIESLDLNGSEAMLWTSNNLGLTKYFPNRVELWKLRCHNPLRRVPRRGFISNESADALILLLCVMSQRLYPLIHQLLSSREPQELNQERWNSFQQRFLNLIEERMNNRLCSVQRILNPENAHSFHRELVTTLSLSVGPGGFNRLRASLLDHRS